MMNTGDELGVKELELKDKNEIDWLITVLPLAVIICLTGLVLFFPVESMKVVDALWSVFVNKLGFSIFCSAWGLFLPP